MVSEEVNGYILETAICSILALSRDELLGLKTAIRGQVKTLCSYQLCNRKYVKTKRAFDKYTNHWDIGPHTYRIDGHNLSRQAYQTYLVSKLDEMEAILSRSIRCHRCLACRRTANGGSHRAFLDTFKTAARLLQARKLRMVNYILQATGIGITVRPQDVKYPDLPEESLNWDGATYDLYRHRDFYIDLLMDAMAEFWKEPNPILRNALGLAFEEGIYSELEDYTGFYADDDSDDIDGSTPEIDVDDMPSTSDLEGEHLNARNL